MQPDIVMEHDRVRALAGEPGATASEPWPEPQPLPDALPAVPAFAPALLPDALRPWIADVAERVQCPIDFPAVACMVALAAVVGRQIAIRPKRQDDWTVVPNLWGAVVGSPGVMKTPALQEALRPLVRLEMEAKGCHAEQARAWQVGRIVAEARAKLAREEVRKAVKAGHDAEGAAAALLEEDETAPVRARYIVNDSTVEKLGELLNQNPRGLLLHRDELVGFLRSLDKEGQEGARAFYLEAWNGTGPFTYDRIGRGTLDIEAACVSILGGIQPGPLSEYVSAAARRGAGDDGLLQRFQLVAYPDLPAAWRNVDRWPDSAAKAAAFAVFDRLDTLDAESVGAEAGDDGPPWLRFAEDAQTLFDKWRAKLEGRLRSGELPPILESHLAKFRSLIPSLALLVHLADAGQGPVMLGALQKACVWGDYLEAHACRVYAPAASPHAGAARALAARIRRGDVPAAFRVRDVYTHGWRRLGTREEVQGAVRELLELDWLAERPSTPGPAGGRPTARFEVNPRSRECAL